jgi:hypothetical protein
LYFPCKVPLNNLNKKSCVHHFDAEAGVEPLFWKKEGDWYSLIWCYPIWYCIWFRSSYCLKESYKNWIITDLGSFAKGTVRKRNIDWLKWSAVCSPKDRGGLGIHDLEIKNIALLVSGCLSYSLRMGLGRLFLRGNISTSRKKLTAGAPFICKIWYCWHTSGVPALTCKW